MAGGTCFHWNKDGAIIDVAFFCDTMIDTLVE